MNRCLHPHLVLPHRILIAQARFILTDTDFREAVLSDFKPGDAINLLTVIFTGLFLMYTIRMWREMVRQNENAEKAYKEGARETDESLRLTRESNVLTGQAISSFTELAGAAKLSADIARDTLYKTQRAYLMVEGFTFKNVDPFGAEFRMFNAGLTVAEVIETVTCAVIGERLPDIPDYEIPERIRGTAPRFIFPGKYLTNNLREVLPMTLSEMKRVMFGHGREQYLLYGRITYKDIFGSKHVLGWSQSFAGEFFANQKTPGYDYAD